MKKTIIGILAHVDAGKTTLTESMLFLAGKLRNIGRVDHRDAFLDYDEQERNRGITIFSKQAMFQWKNTKFTLVDTPGHADFSTEMERTLQILDYAVVVISGTDGVQHHSQTIWELLQHYQIPTFIFVNKMDISQIDKGTLIQELQDKFSSTCIDFTLMNNETMEQIALSDDALLEKYLGGEEITVEEIQQQVENRRIFPCFFGSALKLENIDDLLDGLNRYIKEKVYPKEFGAKVFKVTRDEQGNRLTHMKITGGSLKVKERLTQDEKVDQIRKYSGNQYEMCDEVFAGEVCSVKGLKNIQVGRGLGIEETSQNPMLTSFMDYRIVLPKDTDPFKMLRQFQELAEEDPQLHIRYQEATQEIRIQLMGTIQTEILKHRIQERFHVAVEFDQGQVLYKETILEPVIGVGHFEPLRHYAEVHLLLEPGELNSGLVFKTKCKEDVLGRNWQRLVLTHLEEKEHLGVLTGSPITDVKITLINGRAHLKHTEGGDFRQATYRAVRQGLKSTTSQLLEPYYQFKMEIGNEYLSRAIFDIEKMNGEFTIVDNKEDKVILMGAAPVEKMQNYQSELISYTKGTGRLSYNLEGYRPCLHQEEIIEKIGYDSEEDVENPTGSVFCSHGAGFNVKWDEVSEYQHLKDDYFKGTKEVVPQVVRYANSLTEDEELERIFTRTYGERKIRLSSKETYEKNQLKNQEYRVLPECILVDGYNIIHAWPDLKDLVQHNLGAARSKLMDILCNYQGYKQCMLIVVFDAYKVKGNIGTAETYHNIHVVYTKEAQTADSYIERATHQMAKDYNIIVATSDALEQLIVSGHGSRRMSARELKLEIEHLNKEKLEEFERKQPKHHHFPLEEIKNQK